MLAKLIAEDPDVRSTFAALLEQGLDEDGAVKELALAYLAVVNTSWCKGADRLTCSALFKAALQRLTAGGRADDDAAAQVGE